MQKKVIRWLNDYRMRKSGCAIGKNGCIQVTGCRLQGAWENLFLVVCSACGERMPERVLQNSSIGSYANCDLRAATCDL